MLLIGSCYSILAKDKNQFFQFTNGSIFIGPHFYLFQSSNYSIWSEMFGNSLENVEITTVLNKKSHLNKKKHKNCRNFSFFLLPIYKATP
jgi:hypothetical protein